MTDAPVLTTVRLTLEPLTSGHAVEMVVVLGDLALYDYTGGEPPTVADLERRLSFKVAGSPRDGEVWHNWIARETETGTAVGYVQATSNGPSAEVAWLIGVPWQGRGYATEAARAMVGWLRTHGVDHVEAHIHPDHAASFSVAKALGLAPTGETDDDGELVWSVRT